MSCKIAFFKSDHGVTNMPGSELNSDFLFFLFCFLFCFLGLGGPGGGVGAPGVGFLVLVAVVACHHFYY